MSDKSIRDELMQTILDAIDARQIIHNAILASPVFRRIQAEAWDEGYVAAIWNDEAVCKCSAWNDGECACGNYGNGHQIKRNPYRDATDD